MSAVATPAAIGLLATLAGLLAGLLHFWSLRLVADRLAAGQISAVALQVVRIAGLVLFFYLCTRFGVWALLGAGIGVLGGRNLVLRHTNTGGP